MYGSPAGVYHGSHNPAWASTTTRTVSAPAGTGSPFSTRSSEPTMMLNGVLKSDMKLARFSRPIGSKVMAVRVRVVPAGNDGTVPMRLARGSGAITVDGAA